MDRMILILLLPIVVSLISPAGNHSDPSYCSDTLSYLALGDSYTIGEKVAPAQRYPRQLVDVLRRRGIEIAAPDIIAKTGWTTGELISAIRANPPAGTYDLVTLLIGVNNQYRGLRTGDYRREFRLLMEMAAGFAGGRTRRVVVISIPDWGITPFARDRSRNRISRQINRYNRINRRISCRSGAVYTDISGIYRRTGRRPDMLAKDGLHPSGGMYRLWSDRLLPAVLDILAEN